MSERFSAFSSIGVETYIDDVSRAIAARAREDAFVAAMRRNGFEKVVRCRDCVYASQGRDHQRILVCRHACGGPYSTIVGPYGYCAWGERRKDEPGQDDRDADDAAVQ